MTAGTNKLTLLLISGALCSCSDHKKCTIDKAERVAFQTAKERFPETTVKGNKINIRKEGSILYIEFLIDGGVGGEPTVKMNGENCSVIDATSTQ